MILVGVIAIAVGLCLLVLSPVFVLRGWGSSRDRRRLERAPGRTCVELLGGPSGRCVVVGEIRAGPAGLQAAAVSGSAVAWHRTRVWRRYTHWYMEDDGEELVWEHANPGPFAVCDATGSVLVSPALFDTETASADKFDGVPTELVVDEYQGSDRPSGRYGGPALQTLADRGLLPPGALRRAGEDGTRGCRVQELVLRADQPVYVLAADRRREGKLVLDRPRMGGYLISSRTQEELHAARREDSRSSYGYAGWFLLIGAVLVLAGWLLAVVLPGEAVLGWAGLARAGGRRRRGASRRRVPRGPPG